MTKSHVKGHKRAPRLPGHLLSKDSFTSPGSPEHVSERPCSPTSSVETSSVLDFDDRLSDVSHMGARTGFTRLTQSPLMHSAIVQGTAPKARVKSSALNPVMPTIKSVLGLGGPAAATQQEDSNLRTSLSSASGESASIDGSLEQLTKSEKKVSDSPVEHTCQKWRARGISAYSSEHCRHQLKLRLACRCQA